MLIVEVVSITIRYSILLFYNEILNRYGCLQNRN
jgi:hypothetical protein